MMAPLSVYVSGRSAQAASATLAAITVSNCFFMLPPFLCAPCLP
jgi:hypothetical protein